MTDIAPEPTGRVRPFEALMAVEGRWTGDDRLIMVDGLSWDGLLPISLTRDHGEGCVSIAGRVNEIERVQGATPDERFIVGRGVLDLGGEVGAEAERLIEGGFLRGVSVDLDAVEEGGVDPATVDANDDPMWLLVAQTARIRGLALCPIPAFAEAYITLGSVTTVTTPVPAIPGPTPIPADQVVNEPGDGLIIIASGHTMTIPDCPPAEWFEEPTDVDIEGALTVTDEGRVYGLLAPAGVAHIGRNDGMTVPMGTVDYSRFLRGETIVDGGGRVVTGNVTMSCGHNAGLTASEDVMDHYDNTCSLAATVACGERHAEPRGVWVAGALLPGVTADQVRRMMACQLSGHWMSDGRNIEMLGALLVPLAGFPMARRQASVTMRDGRMVASAIPVRFEPSGPATEPAEDCGCGEVTASGAGWGRLDGIEARLAFLEANTRPVVASAMVRRIKGQP